MPVRETSDSRHTVIGDYTFAEHFVIMKKLTGPTIGLHFMKHNSVVMDTTHGLIHFPHLTHLTMQVKGTASETSAKIQLFPIHDSITVPPMTTRAITSFVDHSSDWNTTVTVTRVGKFSEAASLLISYSMPTVIDKNIAVRVTNATELPYSITQIAGFSVVTPEQSKFIKPVDTASLTMIPESDPDLPTYLSELLKTIKQEQQNFTFWFLAPKNLGKIEHHTPIQTRIFKNLQDLKEKDKLNPNDDAESRKKFLRRFDWTNAVLREVEKQAV